MTMTTKKTPHCSNCGLFGHYVKNCFAPVTSYGCIVLKVPEDFDQAKELLANENSVSGYESIMKDVKFLMIQRKESIGFIEIMRGKYKLNDIQYIKYHIATMTQEEHKKILNNEFDTLWINLWGLPKEQSQNYKNDRDTSKVKFDALKTGITDDSDNNLSFESIIKDISHPWITPEWGFPKGRRDPRESDLQCALRELYEETSILEKDVLFIRNLEPISERFFGSNHIDYCHKYFLLLYNSSKEVKYDKTNIHMAQEIGDIGWFSIDECLNKIRPENIEKKEVLLRAISLLRNYCPLRFCQ
jgi:8-oxo-dGTP pyrophosphatase MutT (NUDIX family)